ncbi:MAG: type II toxin-antitoxin system VapC family toxin [Rhodospirillales bacterium]|nr:MAG: type II toxin-antitoxin system VapC family toxin [Rhodospirillales bacterium]
MTPTFLLDTNIISELAKKKPDPILEKKVMTTLGACALAAPVLEELAFGIARLPACAKQDMLARWLEGIAGRIPILPYDGKAAMWLGHERARLASRGMTAPRTDGEIAAIAFTNGLTLVTRNLADFKWFMGLKVENWFRR